MAKDLADFEDFKSDLMSEIKSLYKESDKKNNELAEQVSELKSRMASGDDLTDITNRIDEHKSELSKVYDTLDKVEKKQSIATGPTMTGTIGQMMLKSGAFDGIDKNSKGTWDHVIEAKDITNAGNYSASPNRNVLVPEHNAGFLTPVDQPLMVRSLIPAGQTSSDVIQRTEEDTFVNGADMVAEGAAKPESTITFKRGQIAIEKIAHWMRASSEVLSDAPMMRSYIDNRLTYGVNFKEERQLLNGNGTSPQLDGLLNTGNYVAYDNTFISGVTPANGVDDIRIAKEQVNGSYLTATGVIMNYKDWARFELMKDGDGKYLHASVTGGMTPRLWGLRVVPSHSMTEGKFHVGSFALGAMIWDRWAMRIMASTEDGDNFRTNKVTILAEKRLALEVFRPDAFVYGDLS
ncbi:phage major capsid protein [Epibacterium ulvae]|uniref:phage major capsid protein n=1 Tax=Epibacterium ulvae TaxID=1156985 RepID=UPI0024934A7E|nr:phage major capsid protein [Epibacterium ulvae]